MNKEKSVKKRINATEVEKRAKTAPCKFMSQNQFFGRRDKNKFCKRRQFLHREREREIVSVCDREMERERETV